MVRKSRPQSKRTPSISRLTTGPSNGTHRTATAFDLLAGMPAGIFDTVRQARQLDKIGAMAAAAIGNAIGNRSPREHTRLSSLLQKLTSAPHIEFPLRGQALKTPTEKGVYIIFGPTGKILHVGSTPRGRRGLAQRLRNHTHGISSFTRKNPKRWRQILNGKCKFSFLIVEKDRDRALLEALAIGTLCPEHVGTGQLRAMNTQ